MEASYPKVPVDRPRSVHEGFSVLDFELRFLALLAAATMRSAGPPGTGIGRSPGLGEWIALLRDARQKLGKCAGTPAARVGSAVGEVLDLYDQGVPSAPRELRAVKRLRDHISHGGPLPSGADELATIDGLVQAISEAIAGCLSDADLQVQGGNVAELRPSFFWGAEEVPLWPFMYVKTGDVWHMFSGFAGAKPSYLCFGGVQVRVTPFDEAIPAALNTLLRAKVSDPSLRDFIQDVRRDLNGFADEDTDPQYFEHEHGFAYYWSKATSEGTEPRRDYFRIGPDNMRQWRSESSWISYSAYLRDLAHWRTVASRLRQAMERTEARLAAEERETLGWTSGLTVHTRDARVIVSDMDGSNQVSRLFSELIDGVDEDLQANRGQTQVVFVNGEAGIGKTRAMVDAAKTRASEVERSARDEVDDRPLLLYVRSTGQVLDSLSTVVSAAVASTRNLTDEAVKTLCRNGLMTLLIDGFDELLGGAGYSDAIGSLGPWLNDLGGRGVMVVSARSSYYVSQYRSSVERANQLGLPAVRHRIAEVQRWPLEEIIAFLDDYGVPSEGVEQLSKRDRELLELPFFTRVFAEMCLSGEDRDLSGEFSLTERLLSQYVAREESKLAYGGDQEPALLNRKELRRTFEVVAEFMAGSDEREADVSDLEMAAELALEQDLGSRRGLKQRLPVLCGLTAASDEVSAPRFRFQHELFFDQFLAGAASYYLNNQETGPFLGMLKQSHWRSATVEGIVASVGAERTAQVLAGFGPSDTTNGMATVAATNLGALWAAVIRSTGRMPSAGIVDAIFSDELDLSDVQPENARLVSCTLSSLVLPSASGWRLVLEGTKVKKIRTSQWPLDLSGLRGVMHADLTELLLPNALLERRHEILDALRGHGAEVIDAEEKGDLDPSADVEAALHFLASLSSRAENSVVLRRIDKQPDDGRLKWTQLYGQAAWKKFVNDLEVAGLASSESFSASGDRKMRLRLKVNATSILTEDPTIPGVEAFWLRTKGE